MLPVSCALSAAYLVTESRGVHDAPGIAFRGISAAYCGRFDRRNYSLFLHRFVRAIPNRHPDSKPGRRAHANSLARPKRGEQHFRRERDRAPVDPNPNPRPPRAADGREPSVEGPAQARGRIRDTDTAGKRELRDRFAPRCRRSGAERRGRSRNRAGSESRARDRPRSAALIRAFASGCNVAAIHPPRIALGGLRKAAFFDPRSGAVARSDRVRKQIGAAPAA